MKWGFRDKLLVLCDTSFFFLFTIFEVIECQKFCCRVLYVGSEVHVVAE